MRMFPAAEISIASGRTPSTLELESMSMRDMGGEPSAGLLARGEPSGPKVTRLLAPLSMSAFLAPSLPSRAWICC